MSDDQTHGTAAPDQADADQAAADTADQAAARQAADQAAGDTDGRPTGPPSERSEISEAPPREAGNTFGSPAPAANEGRNDDRSDERPDPDPGLPSARPPSDAPGASGRPPTATAATAATTGAGSAEPGRTQFELRDRLGSPTTVLPPAGERWPPRPGLRPGSRPDPGTATSRATTRPASRPTGSAGGRARRARLVLQRVDPWSVFLFTLVVSICLGVILLVAVAALYAVLSSLGVLSSVNEVLGEVLGGSGPDAVVEPYITAGRVLGGAAVLAAVDVVLLTALATLGALLYNLCASLTGGVEVVLGEHE